ncbi:MAG: hydroxyacid dehydrogenase [Anaerolineae bacterium]|jgi:phosphoglycerate dehydrogenase-like enzyme|nr:hydroxyacid dehydrogenase [Chloroflexota bacterium]
MNRIHVLVTIPQPLRDSIMAPETRSALSAFADITWNQDGRNWDGAELRQHLPGVDAILASWGLAPLTPAVLEAADRLRFVAYGAGTIKPFMTDAAYAQGVRVSHAAARIAESVADITLLLAMMGLRRPQDFDRRLKAGEPWPDKSLVDTYEIRGKRVGLLGMGYVGRRTAALFQAVGAEVWAFDPYVSGADLAAIGVHKAGLDEVLAGCQVVSVHLPITPETRHMLGSRELGLLQDHAVLVNTSRAWVMDQEALLAELRTGRIWAALDVFEPEPLAADSPLRALDNVLLTPHIAGMTRDSYLGLTAEMVGEIRRFFVTGEPLLYEVTQERLARMA